jgi:hypothetical protein
MDESSYFSLDELKDIYEASKPSNHDGNTEIIQNFGENRLSVLLRIKEFLEKNDGFHSFLSFPEAKYTLLLLRNICSPCLDKKIQEEIVSLFIKCNILNRIIEFCEELMQNRLTQSSFDRGRFLSNATKDDEDTNEKCYIFSDDELSYVLFLCCQLLTNFASLSSLSVNQLLVLTCSSSHPTSFSATPPLLHLLACIQHYNYQNGKSIGIFWHLMFLLISSTSTPNSTNLPLSPSYRSLLCPLFLTLQSVNYSSVGEEDRNKGATNEWSLLFMLQIIKQRKCCQLFQLLGSISSSSSTDNSTISLFINAEQVRNSFLLLLISHFFFPCLGCPFLVFISNFIF